MGEAVSDNNLEKLIGSTRGVKGVHDVFKHTYGRKSVLSMHLEVDKDLSVEESHRITEEVERGVNERYGNIDSQVIHVEPEGNIKNMFEEEIVNILMRYGDIKGFHKVVIRGDKGIDFHIQVNRSMSVGQSHQLVHRLKGDISKFFPGKTNIHVEPYRKS